MTINSTLFDFGPFISVSLGIAVLLLGKQLRQKIRLFEKLSIPDAVVGGVAFSLLSLIIYLLFSIDFTFDMGSRDVFLVYFFTTIGINVSLKDIKEGGMGLLILMGITFVVIVGQNVIGISISSLFGIPEISGLLCGSVSLIGGHGTAIAWAPGFEEKFQYDGLMEVGVACATLGLIFSSLIAGPFAQYLINSRKLTSTDSEKTMDIGQDSKTAVDKDISAHDFLNAILALNVCVICGYLVYNVLVNYGIQVPFFVCSLICGLILSNAIPFKGFKQNTWPSRKPALTLIADVCLGTFLSMSLMSMKLWTLVDLALPVMTILLAQIIFVLLITRFILFPLFKGTYDAAVIGAGFGGYALGSTPIAIASMTSITNKHGPSHFAFLIIPMVCAFFIDLSNNLIIAFFSDLL